MSNKSLIRKYLIIKDCFLIYLDFELWIFDLMIMFPKKPILLGRHIWSGQLRSVHQVCA
jgi:hypothetical protein